MQEIPAFCSGMLHGVAHVTEKGLWEWTLNLIFISAVFSLGWQNEQIPLWGVREAFYN